MNKDSLKKNSLTVRFFNPRFLCVLLTMCLAALLILGSGSGALAAEGETEKPVQDPDMIYTRVEGKPGFYTSVTDSEEKDYMDNSLLDETEKDQATDDTPDPIDNGRGDKQAFWTNDEKTTADIVISYYKPIRPVVYLSSLCPVHPTSSTGLQADHIYGQVKAISDQTDVEVFLEGRDFLGGYYNGQPVYYSGNKASEQSFHVRLNYATRDSLDLVSQNSAGSLFGLTVNGEKQTPGVYGPNPDAIAADESNALSGLLVFGSRGGVTTTGAHSNILEYARDINSVFRGLSEEEKPDFVVISFDSWAWANASFAHESDDWHDDAADMREAAEYLAEYYESGRVLLLTPEGTLQDPASVAAIATNPATSTGTYDSSRESMVMHLYPHAVEATRTNGEGAISWTALEDFKNDPYADPTVINALDRAGAGYSNRTRTVLGQDVLTHSQVVSDYVSDNSGSGAARKLSSTSGPNINTKNNVEYYLMSKRIPFYQFALLDPIKYLEVTDENGVPTEIPDITEWNIDQATNVPYADPDASKAAINEIITTYNQIVITDELDSAFTADEITAYYYDTAEEAWKEIEPNYSAVNDEGVIEEKTDGVVIEGEGTANVSVTINNPAAIGAEVRVVIGATTEAKSFFVGDDAREAEPKDTNVSAQAKRSNTVSGKTFDDSPYIYESPQLRKNPVVEISVQKEWDDQNNAYDTRGDIEFHIERQDSDGTNAIADILPAQTIPGDAATTDELTATWGNVWEEGYTASDGSEVTKEDNVLYSYDQNGEAYIYTVTEEAAEGYDLGAYETDVSAAVRTSDEGETETSWREKSDYPTYDYGRIHETLIIKNKLKTVDIPVIKVWEDESDQDGKRPGSVTFKLLVDGEHKPLATSDTKGRSATLTAATDTDGSTKDEWSLEPDNFKNLPQYKIENGEAVEIVYTVEEDGAEALEALGYTIDDSTGDKDGNYTITNKREPDTASISVKKTWDDDADRDGIRKDDAATVVLYKTVDGKTSIAGQADGSVKKTDGEVITWTELPLFEGGKEITYSVRENVSDLPGYTTSYKVDGEDVDSAEFTLTKGETVEVEVVNSRTPELTSITITKVWEDEGNGVDNHDGLRPGSVTLILTSEVRSIVPPEESGSAESAVEAAPEESTNDSPESAESTDSSVDENEALTDDPSVAEGNTATIDSEPPLPENAAVADETEVEDTQAGAAEPVAETFVEEVELTLTAADGWMTTVDLAMFQPVGQEIEWSVYSVSEVNVPEGYTSMTEQLEDGTLKVTNTHEVTINPPVADPDETVDYKGKPQTGTPTFTADPDTKAPGGGENKIEKIVLLDEDGNEVTNVTVPGEGTYTLNDDGTITFQPEPDFVGKTSGVKVRGYDSNGLSADTTYTPTVLVKVKYIDEDGTVYEDWQDSLDPKGLNDITIPPTPSKEGYNFEGWEETIDEDGNFVRIAKWSPIPVPPTPDPEPDPEPPAPPAPQPQPTPPQNPVVTPYTGDETNPAIWIALAASGLAALFVALRARKK